MILLLVLIVGGLAQSPPVPDDRSVLAEIEAFDRQIATLDAELADADTQIHAAEGSLAGHAQDLETSRADLDQARPEAQALVRSWYKLRRGGFARVLFSASNPAELRRRAWYLAHLLERQATKVNAYTGMMHRRSQAEADAQADTSRLQALRDELENRRGKLEGERRNRAELLRSLRANRSLSARMAQELAAVDVTSRSPAAPAQTAPVPAAVDPADTASVNAAFRAAKGRLPRPVSGPVLHPFGARTNPATGETLTNTGADFSASAGATFRAVFDGTVSRSGYVRGYGQVVVVQHGSYTTLYAHANGLRVAEGQAVSQGDVLGLVGNTGLVDDDAAQLHFEVRYNGTPQDPLAWLAP